jgi:hypothetical protein
MEHIIIINKQEFCVKGINYTVRSAIYLEKNDKILSDGKYYNTVIMGKCKEWFIIKPITYFTDAWNFKMFISIMSIILVIGCSSNIDVNREPDFQSRFLPYFSNAESEQVWLATVNDNMTQEEVERFILPDEWEVYRIQLEDNTRYIDDNGTEISKAEFEMHDYEYKIWTKETFNSRWSKVFTEEGSSQLKIDHLPKYTATQIQLVQMTDEDFLAQDYAKEEGQYALHIYFGEAFEDQEMSLKIQHEVRENIDLINSKINRAKYAKKASKRKEKLLGIDKYPIFILYDHERPILITTELQDISSFMTRE